MLFKVNNCKFNEAVSRLVQAVNRADEEAIYKFSYIASYLYCQQQDSELSDYYYNDFAIRVANKLYESLPSIDKKNVLKKLYGILSSTEVSLESKKQSSSESIQKDTFISFYMMKPLQEQVLSLVNRILYKESHFIYISCLLSLRRVFRRTSISGTIDEIKDSIILYNLDYTFTDFVSVLVKKLYDKLCEDSITVGKYYGSKDKFKQKLLGIIE